MIEIASIGRELVSVPKITLQSSHSDIGEQTNGVKSPELYDKNMPLVPISLNKKNIKDQPYEHISEQDILQIQSLIDALGSLKKHDGSEDTHSKIDILDVSNDQTHDMSCVKIAENNRETQISAQSRGLTHEQRVALEQVPILSPFLSSLQENPLAVQMLVDMFIRQKDVLKKNKDNPFNTVKPKLNILKLLFIVTFLS